MQLCIIPTLSIKMNFFLSGTRRSVLSCGLVLSLIFLFYSFNSFSQKVQDDFKPKLGLIDRESVEMTAYADDSTADAVYLYDYGNVRFSYDTNRGLMIIMDTWVRIKILKESALDRASVSLNYYEVNNFEKDERIDDLKGFTYNLVANQIVTTALDKKSIKKEKSSDKYGAVKFNLPNVKKGSVIEYSYTRTTPFNLRDKPGTWTFQGSIPFKWSEYRIAIPHFLEYKITMGGYLPLHIREQEQVGITVGHTQYNGVGLAYRFVVKDSPAFINEPFITTPDDYLSKISFELATISVAGETIKHYSKSWENVEQTLNQASWFGGELKKSSHLKAVRDEIAAKTKDPEERMKLAYTHLQTYMKWDGYSGLGSKEGVKKAYDNKKGNTSDINLTLTALLRELDLESNPVVLSTRSNGQIYQEIPMLESFNYVISHVKIGEKEYFLDATQPYAKLGLLPEQAMNGVGRFIPKNGLGRFMPLIPKDNQSKLEMIHASILPENGTIKGDYSISYGGYEALRWRDKYAKEPESVYHDDLKKKVPEWKIQDIKIANRTEDLNATLNIACNFEIEDENASQDLFYFNPVLAGRWTENPLKSSERIYPLDFISGISSSYIASFRLPEGYVLEETPKSEIIVLPEKGGKFTYQVRQINDLIQVNSSVIVNQLRFMPDEYGDLREFFERVVQKHAQSLVIKKKAN